MNRSLKLQHMSSQFLHYWDAADILVPRYADTWVATFVGPWTLEGDDPQSVCVWSGVPSLLPRTDIVAFCRHAGEDDVTYDFCCTCNWNDVRQVLGQHMEQLDSFRDWFRVKGFPSQDELESLAQVPSWRDGSAVSTELVQSASLEAAAARTFRQVATGERPRMRIQERDRRAPGEVQQPPWAFQPVC